MPPDNNVPKVPTTSCAAGTMQTSSRPSLMLACGQSRCPPPACRPCTPRARQTTLCSVTSFTVRDGRITAVAYAEPAADLLPVKKGRGFKVGT